jgi:rod shape-determining protein MreD
MILTLLAWLIGVLQVLFKGSFIAGMGSYFLDIDLITVMIGYLLIHSGKLGACLYAFFFGMLIDFFTAGVLGLFALLYMLVFLIMEFGSWFFDLHSIKGQMILVLAGALARQLCLVGSLHIFSYQVHFSSSLFLEFAVSAVVTALIAPFVFSLFEWLEGYFPGAMTEGL